jgi:hypothetical protein
VELDKLCSYLQERLGSSSSGSVDLGSSATKPSNQPNSDAGPPDFAELAASVRESVARVRGQAHLPTSSLLGSSLSGSFSVVGAGGRRTPLGDFNPARTAHILQNLEAALNEKASVARDLSRWLSNAPTPEPPPPPALVSTGKISALPLPPLRRAETTGHGAGAGRGPAGVPSSLASGCSESGGIPAGAPALTSLRRGVSWGACHEGGELGSERLFDIVAVARKWDELDIIHRLQTQAHLAINRELQHMPAELDRAATTERAIVLAAVARATAQLTEDQGTLTQMQAMRAAIEKWQDRLREWSDQAAVAARCDDVKKRLKDLDVRF